MAFTTFPTAAIQIGKAVVKNLWQLTKDNFDDHEARMTVLEGGANKIVVFDTIVDLEYMRVGNIQSSLLTQTQYINKHGVEWDLLDGHSISGSTLATLYGTSTVPDGRAEFIRMLDNGRSVDSGRAMGSTQSAGAHPHSHSILRDFPAGASAGTTDKIIDTIVPVGNRDYTSPTYASTNDSPAGPYKYIQDSTDAEGRPRNVAINYFIKKNDRNLTYTLVFRAPSTFSMVSAKVSNLIAGDSGTLSIDIKKGSSLSSVSTILNSDISVTAASGNYATSSEASFATTAVTQNDFIVMDITGLQDKQVRFHISAYGEV